jgi:hypothetical protein
VNCRGQSDRSRDDGGSPQQRPHGGHPLELKGIFAVCFSFDLVQIQASFMGSRRRIATSARELTARRRFVPVHLPLTLLAYGMKCRTRLIMSLAV